VPASAVGATVLLRLLREHVGSDSLTDQSSEARQRRWNAFKCYISWLGCSSARASSGWSGKFQRKI
jgi:hypothetical protein